MFSQAAKSMIRPSRWRSSGTWAMPRARRDWPSECAPVRSIGSPFTATVPVAVPIAAQHLQQFGLAVAGDAGNAEDFAGAHVEARCPCSRSTPVVVDDPQVLDLQHGLAGRGGLLVDPQQHLAPDHQFGQFARAMVSAVLTVAVISPRRMTLTVSVTSMISRSLWVIRMMVLPSSLQPLEDAEQVIGLGRGQHAGRFVEDQDFGLPVERLEDLDPLLHGRRDRSSISASGSTSSSYSCGQLGQRARAPWPATACSSAPSSAPSMTFSSTVKFSTSLKCWNTMPMPARDRGLAVGDLGLLAVDEDLARVGFVEAVEDRHQRRLAGAVFADDPVDRARHDADRDVLVGLHRAEGLGDAVEFDRRGGSLPCRPERFGRSRSRPVLRSSSAGQLSSDM